MGVFKEIVLLKFPHLMPELQIVPIEHIDSEYSGNWYEVSYSNITLPVG